MVEVELWVPLRDTPGKWLDMSAGLSIPGAGGCAEDEQDMSFYLYASRYAPYYSHSASLGFNPSSGYRGSLQATVSASADDKTFVARFPGSATLVRQNVRCVSHISASSDEVSRFCLGGDNCFYVPPPPSRGDNTPPTVSWSRPRTGQTISGILSERGGNCLVNASDASGIAYTENYVDGKFSDKQVNAPWSCEIDTRRLSDGAHTLKVRAYDRAGNSAEASAHVTVRNGTATPTPPPPPPPPLVPNIEPPVVAAPPVSAPQPVVGPQPVVSPQPVATPQQPPRSRASRLVSTSQAKRQAKRALAEEYRSFRARRRLSINCRPSRGRTVQTCAVRWSAKGRRYAGTVRVSRRTSGYSVAVRVRQTR